jgi:hypothetical protein
VQDIARYLRSWANWKNFDVTHLAVAWNLPSLRATWKEGLDSKAADSPACSVQVASEGLQLLNENGLVKLFFLGMMHPLMEQPRVNIYQFLPARKLQNK